MKIGDLIFWIFIAIIIGTALWMFHGSSQEMNTLILIGLAVAGSELPTWKALFKIDKKTTIGFLKVNHNLNLFEDNPGNKFNRIENKLNNLERLIKKK